MSQLPRPCSPRVPHRCRRSAYLLLALLVVAIGPAHADFRCGVRIVDAGSQMFEVLDACGEPVQVTRSSFLRPSVVWVGGRAYLGDELVSVAVEIWVYNFGSQRLMQQLRFEDGVLVDVVALEKGHVYDAR
jgi:hypothetical protein